MKNTFLGFHPFGFFEFSFQQTHFPVMNCGYHFYLMKMVQSSHLEELTEYCLLTPHSHKEFMYALGFLCYGFF